MAAVESGRLAPVDPPRIREIVTAVTGCAAPGSGELAEAYRTEYGEAPPALRTPGAATGRGW